MKKYDKILKATGLLFIALAVFRVLLFFSNGTHDETNDDKFREEFKAKYGIYALALPESVDFCGEEVPLNDPEIFERFDREMLVNTYWQSSSMLLIKRANKYFPIIEKILKEEGVPEDFKYLAIVESKLIHEVSPAGATGIWQIMEGTGKEYGLEINEEVDERYHLEKSTRAACQYLKEAKEKFGSWTLAAAAYNNGMNGLKRQMKRQKAENYYDLLLNMETARYIFRILSVKEIMTRPEDYGFNFRQKDLYDKVPTYTVTVDTGVDHLADFAHSFEISYKTFKLYNPWLRENYLTNKEGRSYTFEIPKKGYHEEFTEEDVLDPEKVDTVDASPGISDTTETIEEE